ncbi:MAG: hypothetical protein J6Y77_03020 [Paludibacteraceae bacterium]|nr:hypothetical protein [Paludibacteraceae bacterium]
MKKQTFFVLLVAFVLALAACKRNDPDANYDFNKAVMCDSLVVGENGTTLTFYLDIDNHLDTVDASKTHIIQSVLAIAYIDGVPYKKILATADPLYTSQAGQYISFDNEENVLVSDCPFLNTEHDTKISLVFTEEAFQNSNVSISATGYDQNGLKTMTVTEMK